MTDDSLTQTSENFTSDLRAQPQYRFILTDLKSNVIIGELPFQGITYTSSLSKPGKASFTLPIVPPVQELNPKSITTPGRTGIYVFRNDSLVWGGIIWKRLKDSDNTEVRFECESFESYLYKFNQNRVQSWESVDQLQIARDLVNECADQIKLQVASTNSGVNRYKVAFPYEYKSIGSEIESVATLFDGFDWNIQVYVDTAGTIQRQIVWGYPQLGLSEATTNLFYEFPGNITSYTITEDAQAGGNFVTAIGGGEGLDQISSQKVAYDQIVGGWPRLDVTNSYKDTFRPDLLDAKAQNDLDNMATPVTSITLEVSADLDPILGSYRAGDWARFRINDEWQVYDSRLRIIEYTVSVDNLTAQETISLSLGGGTN